MGLLLLSQASHSGQAHAPRGPLQMQLCRTPLSESISWQLIQDLSMPAGLLNAAIWALPQAAMHLQACLRSRASGEGSGPLAQQLHEAAGSVPVQQMAAAADNALQVSSAACSAHHPDQTCWDVRPLISA